MHEILYQLEPQSINHALIVKLQEIKIKKKLHSVEPRFNVLWFNEFLTLIYQTTVDGKKSHIKLKL